RDIDACLQYTLVGVNGDARLNDFYLGSCAPGGYAWVFWKDTDVANVGIGVNLSKIRERADAKKYLDRLIARTPGLARGEMAEEALRAYDAKWRARMEEELARHYLIKERLIRVDDETINKVLRAVSEIGVDRLSTSAVLEAIRAKYPEVLKAFDGLL